MAVKLATCVVCSKGEDVKYKCPSCTAAYCSVSCCKEHKLTCSQKPDQRSAEPCESYVAAAPTKPTYRHETEDTVPVEKLELLRDCQKLKDLLGNPHLRRMMKAIDESSDAVNLISQAMREPIFTEMVDECLKIIQGEEEALSADDFE